MSHTAEDDSKKAQEKEDRKNEERQRIDVYEVWNEVQRTVNREKIEYENAKRTAPYWKTVRIFVSSTFRDFHTEREELVKKVFPELRTWCEERKVHLVDCDLRWGVPADTQYEITLRICLDEINRCYEDNVMPYFMNMTSKRIGWIPMKEELTDEIISEFDLIIGLSVTEMEIVHAAYRQDNPNALFFIRDDSFTDSIADETVRKQFIDELQPIASKKLKMLKQKIEERFPRENVCAYTCSYVHDEKRDPKDRPRLQLDDSFSKKVLEFFKTRIELQYPVVEAGNLDKFQIAHGQQEAFMKDRGANVVGREETLQEVCDYIASTSETEPLVILGDSGAGKSAFMALVADKFTEEPKQDGLLLFYHFIGATPGSTSLLNTLLRFLKSVESLSPEGYELPIDLNDAIRDTSSILGQGHPNNKLVVIIDAINQFDGDVKDQLYSWLPRTLGSNVRCVLSMVNGSLAHEALKGRGLKEASLKVLPVLDLEQKMEIVTEYLKRFRKTLDQRQLVKLLKKKSSDNPLWLKIACEELRVYGDFKKLTEQIEKLPDSLTGLLKSVLKRYATDIGEENLLKSTLCLLEVSALGLLEVELLEILAKIDGTPDQSGADGVTTRLPAAKWASVYRNLRPFLRPFGNAGEGRLYFYHQSLREVVKMEYLNTGTGSLEWHSHLANYFETSGSYERKIEEYPYHLIKLIACNHDKQRNSRRLERFLCDWKAFDMLHDSEFSESLMMYWRRVGTDQNNIYNRMVICYEEELEKVRRDREATREERREKLENVSRLFTQAGLYGEALPLAKECLSIITGAEESEEKQENLMYIYGHIANIETQNMPFTQSSKDIPKFEEIIEYHDRAIQIIDEMKKKEETSIQRYKALQLMKKGFSLGQIADRTSGFFSKGKQQQYRAAGLENANEAVQIYNSLHDIRHLLEAYLTQGTLYLDTQKRHELNKRAISLCEQSFGPYDQFIARVSYNEGIAYEDEKDYKQAYSNFRRAYKVANELLGSSHPKTQKFKQALMEGRYKKIAKELNDDLEKLFMSNV